MVRPESLFFFLQITGFLGDIYIFLYKTAIMNFNIFANEWKDYRKSVEKPYKKGRQIFSRFTISKVYATKFEI